MPRSPKASTFDSPPGRSPVGKPAVRLGVLHFALPAAIAAYAVLALYANNLGQVTSSDVLRSALGAPSLALLIVLGLYAALRNADKAAVLATSALVFIFSYGHVHNLIGDFAVAGFRLGRHSLLLGAWLLVLCALAAFVLRTRRSLSSIVRTLTIAALALLAIPSILILSSWISSAAGAGRTPAATAVPPPVLQATDPLPDIYYIILDGYGRADILCGLMGVDNRPFLSSLTQRGFFVADQASSNYAQTLLSLGSSLGMTHLTDFTASLGLTSRNVDALQEFIRHGPVRQALEAIGYQTVAFETGFPYTNIYDADVFWRTASGPGSLPGLNPFEGMFLRTTAAVLALDADALRDTDFGRLVHQSEFDRHRQRIEGIFDRLAEVPRMRGPQFVFAHIIAPHPPFVFGPEGEPVQQSETFTTLDAQNFPGTQDEYRLGYAGQLTYVNARLEALLDAIFEESEVPPIIILQGDHGPGSTFADQATPYRSLQERLGILEAVYLSTGQAGLYASLTPVNLFRTVFNHAFQTKLPLLPDTTFYSEMEAPYAFEELTEAVDPRTLTTPWSCAADSP